MGSVESVDQLLVLPHEGEQKKKKVKFHCGDSHLRGRLLGYKCEISHIENMRCYEIIYKGE